MRTGSVLVTGGAKRIGKAICDELRGRGWKVLVHSREAGNPLTFDLSDPLGPARLFQRACDLAPDLCAIVNNAAEFSTAAALPPDVRTFTLPKWVPPSRIGLFLVGVALASSRRYAVLHGIDEGADVARWVDRATVNHFAYVAEIRRGGVGKSTVRHASAVIASAEENLSLLKEPPPKGRVSVIPDPHAELVPDTFTFAEFSDALEGVYTYVRRLHPEIVQP